MKWTDEAIEVQLRSLDTTRAYGLTASEELLECALLELKRVRAWVLYGCDDSDTANGVLNGDPAPTDEQENKR